MKRIVALNLRLSNSIVIARQRGRATARVPALRQGSGWDSPLLLKDREE